MAFIFALLFSVLPFAQHWYGEAQLLRAEQVRLSETIFQVTAHLTSGDTISIARYRRWQDSTTDSKYALIDSNNELIDVKDRVPEFVSIPALQPGVVTGPPRIQSTVLGESWLLSQRSLRDGRIIAAISSADLEGLVDPRRDLTRAIDRFGTTLENAKRVNLSDLPTFVSGIYFFRDGDPTGSGQGVLPIRVRINLTPSVSAGVRLFTVGDKQYAIARGEVADRGQRVYIYAYDDVSSGVTSLTTATNFDYFIAAATWILSLLSFAAFLVWSDIRTKRQLLAGVTLAEALRRGEGQTIEFKAGIGSRTLPIAIVSFANTNAGNIFVGVTDTGRVEGLQGFVDSAKTREQVTQKIGEILRDQIKPGLQGVKTEFVQYEDLWVLHIFVPRGEASVYLINGVAYERSIGFNRVADTAAYERMMRSRRSRLA